VEYTSYLSAEGSEFSLKAYRGTNHEVHATYKKDEIEATIVLKLQDNHPLRAPAIVSETRLGVNEATWRKWILSMTTLLLTQDGRLVDAAVLWQKSLDKHFEGIELCPICYSVFHSSNLSTPNMTCKTCKSTYHSLCLYKWFNSSHRNECPMCKSIFN